MSQIFAFVLAAILTSGFVDAAPAALPVTGSSVAPAVAPSETVLFASDLHNGIMWNTTTDSDPQPMRGQLGGTILAQQNIPLQQQNPDILAPPTTDHNTVSVSLVCSLYLCSHHILSPNVKWPFSLSPTRLNTGGFARQQNSM